MASLARASQQSLCTVSLLCVTCTNKSHQLYTDLSFHTLKPTFPITDCWYIDCWYTLDCLYRLPHSLLDFSNSPASHFSNSVGDNVDGGDDLRQFTSVTDIPTRQRLRSSISDNLCVPAVRLPTVGRRAFSVARACLESSSCRCHFSTFSVHFPKTFKTASLFTLLSMPCPLN